MPIETYETLFLLDATRLASDADEVKSSVRNVLERYGAEILVERPWDDRKLIYPIKKQKKGTFHIFYYKLESTKQKEIDTDMRINDNVLRYLTVKLDPKWTEMILEVAYNEQSSGFALRGLQEEANAGDVTPNLGEVPDAGEAVTAAVGGRRPPRRQERFEEDDE